MSILLIDWAPVHTSSWLLPEQVPEGLKEMLGPDAPDVCIEAVGFHYMSSWLHKIESALMLETDTSEILNELIYCCRKASLSRACLIREHTLQHTTHDALDTVSVCWSLYAQMT